MGHRLDLYIRLIGRSATTLEEQTAALADIEARGFAAVDLTREVRETIVLVEIGDRMLNLSSMSVDTSWLVYQTIHAWGYSYSIAVGNEADRYAFGALAGTGALLRSMVTAGLVERSGRDGRWVEWTLTPAGLQAARRILGR